MSELVFFEIEGLVIQNGKEREKVGTNLSRNRRTEPGADTLVDLIAQIAWKIPQLAVAATQSAPGDLAKN